MENTRFYSVPKTPKGINIFLELFWGFHDFRIFTVHYYPQKDCIDLILEYDTDELKVLLRFEDCPYMNFAWQDFAADWMYGASIFFDTNNRFVFVASDEFDGNDELPETIFWLSSKKITWTVVDNDGNPRDFNFKELHPGWIKKSEINSGEYEINESLYSKDIVEDIQFSTDYGQTPDLSYQELIKNYPPHYSNRFKADFYKAALVQHKDMTGTLKVYQTMFNQNLNCDYKLPFSDIKIINENSFFNYKDFTSSEKESVWYLNFADTNLFGFYGSNLFAQDEIQTLEHPLLGSVREYLLKNQSFKPKTIYIYRAHGLCYPTPVLVENVPYWISVDTKPLLDDGNIGNLYGNNFANASEEEIAAGIKIFEGDIKSNIIAVAALSNGNGPYTKQDISFTLKTVLCAFEKSRFISRAHHELSEDLKFSIHTGNWGCGVFGNDRELIYLIQMLAASLTGISEIYFHAPSLTEFEKALKKFNELKQEDKSINQIIDYLFSQNYSWHSGDGN